MTILYNGLNDKDDSKEGIEKYLKRNPTTSFVAVCENKVVGVILCGHDGRRGIIQHACVSPDFRYLGIGSKLVDLAMEALRAGRQIDLYTWSNLYGEWMMRGYWEP